MKRSILCLVSLLATSQLTAQTKTIAEQLGYPADAKLLIIHADDLGVSHSENEASIAAWEKGSVSSASIMVPTPWFPEIAHYAATHPAADLGLHLTLTSEWKFYKWGPVMPTIEVNSLLTSHNYFPPDVEEVVVNAKINEAEKELRAQVDKAKLFSVDFTHFDTHMGTLMATPDLLKLYIKLGHEYKVPILLHRGLVKARLGLELDGLINKNDVVVDQVYIASPDDFKKGMKEFYSGVLNSVKPGLSCLLLHAAFNNSEMQAVTIDHPDYGAAWRQADYDFFISDDCKKIIKDQKIQLVTWKEIRDKIVRR